jgi:DNA-binding NtrC family response regulator
MKQLTEADKSDKPILIVDDEPDMCWALQHILEKHGFSAEKTSSGREAIALVQQHHFRNVFLDAKLPDIDGLKLAKLIRELDPSVHIVIISGYFYRDDVDVQKAMIQGEISGFISKPFDNKEILSVLHTIIPL